MGQLIDLDRRRQAAQVVGSGSTAESNHALRNDLTGSVLLPTVAIWRMMVGGWASLMLAPLGLTVRPIASEGSGGVDTRRDAKP